ncbi:MAG: hypothetical protein IJV43_08960, partial [Oscillospiraceae bacterium]|nr:hypothetical protein [Oscillospiraceae bacterium]
GNDRERPVHRHFRSAYTRPCLKYADMPKRRVFFRHTAAIFLAIHKVLPRQIGLVRRKNPSPLVALPIFQTRPELI